jgi:catalase
MSPGEPRPAPHNPLADDVLAGLDQVFGTHPGFRAVHAKGLMCRGSFVPTPDAARLTRAPHLNQPSTSIVARFSDFAGVPNIPDNHREASPRGMAIRFYLGEHVHTDIVAHSHDGFPVHTGEEFLEFVRALAASGPDAPKPTPIERFLGAHPSAMRFATSPMPFPTSFARESFFGVSALKFTNREGASQFGRYRLRPEAGGEYLSDEDAAKKGPNYLSEELSIRIAQGAVKFQLFAQLAATGDVVNDASVHWPDDRPNVQLGTITLTERVDDQDPELRKIIFDPIPRVDGLEPSDDPLWNLRADIYLLSGRRRRQASRS